MRNLGNLPLISAADEWFPARQMRRRQRTHARGHASSTPKTHSRNRLWAGRDRLESACSDLPWTISRLAGCGSEPWRLPGLYATDPRPAECRHYHAHAATYPAHDAASLAIATAAAHFRPAPAPQTQKRQRMHDARPQGHKPPVTTPESVKTLSIPASSRSQERTLTKVRDKPTVSHPAKETLDNARRRDMGRAVATR